MIIGVLMDLVKVEYPTATKILMYNIHVIVFINNCNRNAIEFIV